MDFFGLRTVYCYNSVKIPQSTLQPTHMAIIKLHTCCCVFQLAEESLPYIGRGVKFSALDTEAIQAFVWMSGEFPFATQYTHDLFTLLIDQAFDKKSTEEEDHFVVLKDVLIAATKILFVNPQGIKHIFANLLEKVVPHH